MRKLILIAAMSLLASQAYAGGPRSLSLAATNASPQTAESRQRQQPRRHKVRRQRPRMSRRRPQPQLQRPGSDCDDNRDRSGRNPVQCRADCQNRETTKPKRRQPSTEARVIRELHRHGIYW